MGASLTTFENHTGAELQLRFFRTPARPDHFYNTITIRAGEKVNTSHSDLRCNDTNDPEMQEVIMIFIDGVWASTGLLLPSKVIEFSRVICSINKDGSLAIRGNRKRGLGCFGGGDLEDLA